MKGKDQAVLRRGRKAGLATQLGGLSAKGKCGTPIQKAAKKVPLKVLNIKLLPSFHGLSLPVLEFFCFSNTVYFFLIVKKHT